MSAGTDGIVCYQVTRLGLIDALAALPLGRYLTLEARARFADCILAQLPEASPPRAEAEPDEAGHYVLFANAGWVMKHPDLCRFNDDEDGCGYEMAIRRVIGHGAPAAGRWRITGISEGLPDLERVEPQP